MRGCHLLPALAAALLVAGCAAEPEWPQWRGPGSRGVSGATGLPTTWSPEAANIAWRTPIPGAGHSSPVVADGRVFLATAVKIEGVKPRATRRVVLAVDLASGELLWQRELFAGPTGPRHWMNQGASSTPVTDGKTVFAYFGAVLGAVDRSGELLWSREFQPYPVPGASYGPGSSLVLTDRAVIVMQDREGQWEAPGWIAAFDRRSGEPLWRDEWEHTCCSYSTPVLLERAGGRELLRYDSKEIVVYDPDDGERLWTAEHRSTQTVPTPVWEGDLLVLPGSMHTRSLVFLRLSGSGSETRSEVIAEFRQGVPELSSPVLVDGLLFTVTRRGVLSCYRAESGTLLWQKRLRGEYIASLVAGDGKVYASNREGHTYVLAADEQYQVLAENEIGERVFASPAIAGGCLLMRTKRDLVCIRGESAPA